MKGQSHMSLREITGVILVGGKSRRMGRDKALMTVGGKTLFESVLEVFQTSFSQILLAGDRGERFAEYRLPIHTDIYPGSSMGGLYTGLFRASTDAIFVASCDLPFPSSALMNHLCSLADRYDAVVPRTAQGCEPLFAVYAKSCLEPLQALLEEGRYSILDLYPKINVRFVEEQELSAVDAAENVFLNLNTPAEYQAVMESL